MRIEFEPIGGGRHAVVIVEDHEAGDAETRRRMDVVVSGDVKDNGRPLWFWGNALSGAC